MSENSSFPTLCYLKAGHFVFFPFFPLTLRVGKREGRCAEAVGDPHWKAHVLFCILILSTVLYKCSPQLVGVGHMPVLRSLAPDDSTPTLSPGLDSLKGPPEAFVSGREIGPRMSPPISFIHCFLFSPISFGRHCYSLLVTRGKYKDIPSIHFSPDSE